MTISHDAQLLLLGASISLVSSIITVLINHYLSLHADKVKRARDKDASLKSIIVPTSSSLPEAVGHNKLQIHNVTAHSYGVSIVGEVVHNVIYKSDNVPVERSITFYSRDNIQKKLNLWIWENVSNNVTVDESECSQIGSLEIDLPSDAPSGLSLNTRFQLNEDGLLNVTTESPIIKKMVSASFQVW